MRQTFLAVNCVLLTVLCFSFVLPATVRPYKFGFTIEEQQHRREQRDENGIVMGEFGFITADGIYHVTVYATDEEGKFRIISMKNYPYAGPVAPKSPPPTTTTTAASVARHHFNTAACSGCFLNKSPPPEAPQPGIRPSTKTEIRPLSQPLSPSAEAGAVPAVQSGQQPFSAVGNAAAGALPALTGTQQQTAAGVKPPLADSKRPQQPTGSSSSASFKPNTVAALPDVTATKQQSQPPSSGNTASNNTPQPTSTKTATNTGAVGEPGLTGDLYKFKYILDYNGHEETGSRNGDKVGNYFAIGDDDVERVVEYIANEFGFQPHISWRKLEGKEATLPDENSLKHYEFKWFNKASQ
ncbi:protein lethal(3)malignant blood neoplasm 1 [Drosophila montana]|uniref:protein lethal(3)malignant blood neoplasm 1 n=1 Tax=Drosophila montana TaxID=40370 RepID=UPI00313CFBC6